MECTNEKFYRSYHNLLSQCSCKQSLLISLSIDPLPKHTDTCWPNEAIENTIAVADGDSETCLRAVLMNPRRGLNLSADQIHRLS